MNSTLKSLLFWMALVVVLALIWQFSTSLNGGGTQITFSEFMTRVKNKEVGEVTFTGNEITGKYSVVDSTGSAKNFSTYVPPSYEGLANKL